MSEASPGSPRYMINRVIFDLSRAPDARALVAKKTEFLARYPLSEVEKSALARPDWTQLLALGVLPNLVYRYYMLHGNAPESFPAAIAGERTAG
ncbi:MAG TPA: hypothetical protein VLV50_07660 [Stellaceae bacterium]|nr:hypothetical protein [Stellaceae bacterium]